MTKSKANPSGSAVTPLLLVFGVDENDKPRAARFTSSNPDLVAKAAQAMALIVCEGSSPELAEIATKLPTGRLYANGRGFVPYVRRELYVKLVAATGLDGQAGQPSGADHPAESAVAAGLPASWDDVDVGHLVIAHESAQDGWWEAIVVEKNDDMLTLRWRDFPRFPKVVRHRATVALLNPSTP